MSQEEGCLPLRLKEAKREVMIFKIILKEIPKQAGAELGQAQPN